MDEHVNIIVNANAQLPETILTLTTSNYLPNSQLVLTNFAAKQQNQTPSQPSSLTVISAPQAESEAKSTLPWVFSVSPTPEKTRKRGPGRPRKTRSKAVQQAKEIEEDGGVEGKTAASRTRSGRLSKPPIQIESLHNASPKHPALTIGSDYETCRSKQVSDEGPGEFEAPGANYPINKNTSFAGRTWKRGRKRAGPYWLHTPAVQQEKKNHRLAEAVTQLDDDEFLSLFGSRVASMTTWDFLLMKARKKNPFSILPTLLTEVKNLAQSLSSLAKKSLVPHMTLEQDTSSKLYQLTDSGISGLIGLPCGTYEIVNNSSLIEHASSTCQQSLEHASPSRSLPCGSHKEMWSSMEDAMDGVKNHLEASDLKIRNLFSRSVNDKDQNLAQANDNGVIAGVHHDESVSLSGLGVADLMQVDDMVNQAACDVGSTDSLLLALRPDLPGNKKLVTQFDLSAMEAFAIPAHGEDSSSSLSKDFFTEALRKSFPNC